jgi:hypothetical protein
VFHKLDEGRAYIFETQSAAARHVYGRKFFRCNGIDVEMENKFARVGMHLHERIV